MLRKRIMILAVLLVLVSAAAFAQATVNGSVQYDASGTTTLEKDKDAATAFESDLLGNSNLVIGYTGEAVSGNLIIRTGGAVGAGAGLANLFDFRATWKISDFLSLTGAYSWLPGTFFSGLALDTDVNAFLGASAIGRTGHLRLNIDGAYLGFWTDPNTASKAPGFFAGYDYRAQSFSVGINGAGTYNIDTEIFAVVGSLHGTVSFGPAAVKANLAVYKDGNGFTAALTSLGTAKDDFNDKPFLEGLLEFDYTLGIATIVVTAAYGRNLDSGADSLQAGLAVPVQVATGFRVIPGLIYRSTLSDGANYDNAISTIKYGVSLNYSF